MPRHPARPKRRIASSLAVVAVWVSLAWPTIGAADDSDYDQCLADARAVADRILQDAADVEDRHQNELDGIVRRFQRRESDGESGRDVIDAIIQHQTERSSIDRARQELIDDWVARVLDVGDPEDKDFQCRESRYLGSRSGSVARYRMELESLREDIAGRLDLELLDDDEGLVVIAFYSFGPASSISINRLGALTGGIEFGPVNNDEYFQVLRVKAGEYRWERIRQEFGISRYFYDLGHRDLTFTVEPGKLNYTGVFTFRPRGTTARSSLNDRTSIVLLILEQRYPNLLERFEIANGLVPDDRFIDYYLAEERRQRAESGDD